MGVHGEREAEVRVEDTVRTLEIPRVVPHAAQQGPNIRFVPRTQRKVHGAPCPVPFAPCRSPRAQCPLPLAVLFIHSTKIVRFLRDFFALREPLSNGEGKKNNRLYS